MIPLRIKRFSISLAYLLSIFRICEIWRPRDTATPRTDTHATRAGGRLYYPLGAHICTHIRAHHHREVCRAESRERGAGRDIELCEID